MPRLVTWVPWTGAKRGEIGGGTAGEGRLFRSLPEVCRDKVLLNLPEVNPDDSYFRWWVVQSSRADINY